MKASFAKITVIVTLLATVAGCRTLFRKKEVEEVDAGEGPAAAAEEAIPAPQDYEEEAIEGVSTTNYKAELARLKKEISTK
ncbi:MAG TPA: hypothetical protein VJT73_05515 [Polyangiaceae bacterium]|nr:hypothetical protein [Polyangiaceae bacterium]